MFILSEDKKWYRVGLRLMGDGLPIEMVEAKIGLPAKSAGKKGEHINGNLKSAKLRTNIWTSQYLTNSDVTFEEQITIMLDALEPKANALKEILSLPKVEGELFLGFGSGNGKGGAEFSPALLKRIADFGLTLSLDLYPPSIDEEK